MNSGIVHSKEPVLLVGGGDFDPGSTAQLLRRAGTVVAADGGAEALIALGRVPDAVIGDMDSLSPAAAARIPADRIHHIAEQDSTDFDKCLRNIEAPLIWCAGFLGARVDHELAALTVLARRTDKRCILIGRDDVITLTPRRLEMELPAATRVSLYPMRAVTGRSTGLRWPIDGIDFRPDGRTGTSNESSAPVVTLETDGPGLLLILPAMSLPPLERALEQAPRGWPRPA